MSEHTEVSRKPVARQTKATAALWVADDVGTLGRGSACHSRGAVYALN